jgi:hypothetical protein
MGRANPPSGINHVGIAARADSNVPSKNSSESPAGTRTTTEIPISSGPLCLEKEYDKNTEQHRQPPTLSQPMNALFTKEVSQIDWQHQGLLQ